MGIIGQTVEVEVTRLQSGTWIARPKGSVGTVGWSPFPWTLQTGESAKGVYSTFCSFHKKTMSHAKVNPIMVYGK